ncbi:MAG: hypothetical protein U9R25_12465 [Chloroflexota bacterium]|nr:hypothetical protein [Chloroflexota bacterium]
MTIDIRPVESHAGYRAVERLQRQVWSLPDADIVPDHMLLTIQKNGGLVLGAFSQDRLLGFVFGFLGLTSEGRLKHCSHMAAVVPEVQNRGLGFRLKLAQRDHVLAQGIDLITWTYDPLEGRNARLNLRKLGAVCNTYLRDLYGEMRDGLNQGLASDRFRVDWQIGDDRVGQILGLGRRRLTISQALAGGAVLVNKPAADAEGLLQPAATNSIPVNQRLLIAIPQDFQRLKGGDLALARRWRAHTRALFEEAFAARYVAVDFLVGGRFNAYLLSR